MSYSLVVPPHLVESLYKIREATGVSIRRQILEAITKYLNEYSLTRNQQQEVNEVLKDALQNT